jgi:single-stranded-DNA-specific exonuclease
VRDALAAIDAAHPGLIERFGGHAMAAGMSLPAGHLEAFREAWHATPPRGWTRRCCRPNC